MNDRQRRYDRLTENGFAEPYRIPDNPSEAAVTTHADALLPILEDQPSDTAASLSAKATLRAKFIAYELPEDFVADLRADREALRTANQHNQGETQGGVENTAEVAEGNSGGRKGGRAAIGEILGRAAEDVQQLDAIMHNKYARQPEKLRAWQSVSRVERAPQREKKPDMPFAVPKP